MRRHRTSSATGRRPLSVVLRHWLVVVLAVSALSLTATAPPAVASSTVLAQETVTSGDFEDKNGDGFRDEDPSQPWPLYVIGIALVGASIFITYKLVRSAMR